ncbi:hypothetical protein [Craterilacuibacter sinensis]|uniref:Uncharacterized protein n=1 Tax=Craterilacuibacter sinensis TaxID=2686017 RepID=A0A845BNA3_9NEIS|nr:hypothetical protein [Craterilacuibacter sinensis]MXR36880.1 hypothetical protein [Craterilacuibacter sinensis]
MRRLALALTLCAGLAGATDCPGLAGRFEIQWPNEAAQPMRVLADSKDGQAAYRVEIGLPDGRWVPQRTRALQGLYRSELGLLPRCGLEVAGYGLFARSRAFAWTGLPGAGQAEWAFWAGKALLPVQRLGD